MITIKSIFTAANINDAIRSIKDKVVEIFTQPTQKEDLLRFEDVPVLPPTVGANTFKEGLDKINSRKRGNGYPVLMYPIKDEKTKTIENGGRIK